MTGSNKAIHRTHIWRQSRRWLYGRGVWRVDNLRAFRFFRQSHSKKTHAETRTRANHEESATR